MNRKLCIAEHTCICWMHLWCPLKWFDKSFTKPFSCLAVQSTRHSNLLCEQVLESEDSKIMSYWQNSCTLGDTHMPKMFSFTPWYPYAEDIPFYSQYSKAQQRLFIKLWLEIYKFESCTKKMRFHSIPRAYMVFMKLKDICADAACECYLLHWPRKINKYHLGKRIWLKQDSFQVKLNMELKSWSWNLGFLSVQVCFCRQQLIFNSARNYSLTHHLPSG